MKKPTLPWSRHLNMFRARVKHFTNWMLKGYNKWESGWDKWRQLLMNQGLSDLCHFLVSINAGTFQWMNNILGAHHEEFSHQHGWHPHWWARMRIYILGIPTDMLYSKLKWHLATHVDYLGSPCEVVRISVKVLHLHCPPRNVTEVHHSSGLSDFYWRIHPGLWP